MANRDSKPVAAVVGVGTGLGSALARRFAEGYRVALIARKRDFLEELAAEIKARGGDAIAVPANVANASEIETAFASIRRELSPIDIPLYNAAMRPFGRLMETKPSTFENTWRLNAFGAFLCSQQVVPAMLRTGGGAILADAYCSRLHDGWKTMALLRLQSCASLIIRRRMLERSTVKKAIAEELRVG